MLPSHPTNPVQELSSYHIPQSYSSPVESQGGVADQRSDGWFNYTIPDVAEMKYWCPQNPDLNLPRNGLIKEMIPLEQQIIRFIRSWAPR